MFDHRGDFMKHEKFITAGLLLVSLLVAGFFILWRICSSVSIQNGYS